MSDRSAFTLIELLVTIAIISILSLFAIPQYTKYKKNAALAVAEASLHNCINSKLAQFAADEKEDEEMKCKIGGEEAALTINNEGIIDDVEKFIEPTIKGIKITCGIKDGLPDCKLAESDQ